MTPLGECQVPHTKPSSWLGSMAVATLGCKMSILDYTHVYESMFLIRSNHFPCNRCFNIIIFVWDCDAWMVLYMLDIFTLNGP